jgi:hypothetical protein
MQSLKKVICSVAIMIILSVTLYAQDTLRGKWQFQINFGLQFFEGYRLENRPQNFEFKNLTNPAFEGGIGFLYHISNRVGIFSGVNFGFMSGNFRHTVQAYDSENKSLMDYYVDEQSDFPPPYVRLKVGPFYRQSFTKGLSMTVGLHALLNYFAKASRISESYFKVNDVPQPDAEISFSRLNNANNVPTFGLNPEIGIQRMMPQNTTLGFMLGMNWSPQHPVTMRYSYLAPGILEAGTGRQQDISYYIKATVTWGMKKKS